jgi:hypothetical protein
MLRTIHPLSDVQSQTIGEGTRIWQFSVVLAGAKVAPTVTSAHVFIENDVVIAITSPSRVVQLWDGLR